MVCVLFALLITQTKEVNGFLSYKAAQSGLLRAAVTYGDTAGASMVFEDVAITRGAQELIKDVNWRVNPGERWSIIGPNGAGKTSLLKAATGELDPVVGKIIVKPGVRVGYLQQTAVSGSTLTVREELESCMPGLIEAQKKKEQAENAVALLGDISEEQLTALADAEIAFQAANGYSSSAQASNVARGLGFTENDMSRKCSEFSGGWQMRIALARLLLSEPHVMLLDEPSNHLDTNARQWLAGYLQQFQGSLILISHDEQLLSVACDSTAELMNTGGVGGRRLELYKSKNLLEWRRARLDRARQWRTEYERQQTEMNELKKFIQRFGAKASKAAQAQDRKNKLHKLQKNAIPPPPPDLLHAIDAETSPSTTIQRASLILPAPPSNIGDVPLKLIEASLSYSNETILKDVTLEIESGSRIVILGPNGAGKSTLIKLIAGDEQLLTDGQRLADPRLRIAVFSQDLSQELDPELTGLELVVQAARRGGDAETSEAQARKVLGALGLSGDKALRASRHLSGGEKAKIALASFALTEAHLLILDEPSNHADVQCIAALLRALQNFEGTLLIVSHDRPFVEALAPSHVLIVDKGRAKLEARDLCDNDWIWTKATRHSTHYDEINKDTNTENKEEEQLRRRRYNAPKLLAKLESQMQEQESKLAKLDKDLVDAGSDVTKCLQLAKERDALQADLDAMYAEYEELEELQILLLSLQLR